MLIVVSLPMDVLKSTTSLVSAGEKLGMNRVAEVGNLRTSIDTMSPKNVGLLALEDIPLAPGIKGHSIIAIKGDEEPPEGDDGVVKYTSAHVDYVESEFVVRSGHSSQGHPLVIEEVRRILREHLESVGGESREPNSSAPEELGRTDIKAHKKSVIADAIELTE